MEKRADYTVVGIFVVVLGVCFVSFFFWLSAKKHDVEYKTYVIYTNEDVTGLEKQSPVRFNGVAVGFVNEIDLDAKNPQLVRVKMEIAENTPITTSTYATLNTQGITGLIYVGLKAEDKTSPRLEAKPGEPFPVLKVKRSILSQITNVVPMISDSVTQSGKAIQELLSEKNRSAVERSLANMQQFTSVLATSSQRLSVSIQNLDKTLSQTAIATKQLPEVMGQLQSSLHQINQTARSIQDASSTIDRTAKTSDLFVQNLNHQTVPEINQTMLSIKQVMANLSQLVVQISRNPSQLVRGRAQSPLGPGER